jgi:hypothetical protein
MRAWATRSRVLRMKTIGEIMKPWSYFMHRTLADALEGMKASA